MEITNIDGVLFYGLEFANGLKFHCWSELPYRFRYGTYVFLIGEGDKLYKKLHNSDYVTFMAGDDKIIAQIYLIKYLDGYNRYYCKEVEENENL